GFSGLLEGADLVERIARHVAGDAPGASDRVGGGRDLEQGEHRQGEQHGRLLRKRGWSGAFRTAIMLRGRGSGASLASPSRGSAAACCRRRSGSEPSTPHLSIDIYIDSYLYAQMSD